MDNPMRKAGLFSAEVDEQTLIYDSAGDHTHCLNPQALKVWKLCDGRHSRNDMVLALKTAAGQDAAMPPGDTEDLVDAALGRFADLDMLEDSTLLTRRAVGKAALKALVAGLVISVLMPTRAAAGSESCESLWDPVTCTRAGCEWSNGACITPSTGTTCDSLDEDACGADPRCLWIGICINNDG